MNLFSKTKYFTKAKLIFDEGKILKGKGGGG